MSLFKKIREQILNLTEPDSLSTKRDVRSAYLREHHVTFGAVSPFPTSTCFTFDAGSVSFAEFTVKLL